MNNYLIYAGLFSAFSLAVSAAESGPLNDIKAAARALAQQQNYAWVSTPRSEGSSAAWRQGPLYGQTEKDGYTYFKFELGENTIEAAFKGGKRAIKLGSSWESADELVDDRAWIARALKAHKAPAGEAEDLAQATTKPEKQADGALGGSLTEEKVKDLLLMGRRADTPPKDIKGSVRFWLKGGVLIKYEFNIQGKVTGRDGQELEINRTTTVEVNTMGSTKVPIPDEAKEKL
jgi:hypothetical protein